MAAAVGRSAALGQSGMRRQGERAAQEIPPEERTRIAASTFRTSNHYVPSEGHEGVGQPVKETSRTVLPSKMPRELVKPMPDSIDPFPVPKPGVPARGQQGTYQVAERGLGRPKKAHDLDFVNPDDRFDAQKSVSGKVPNGLHDSRGFIETTTEQQRRQAEALSEDTLDAFRKGREKELDLQRQRAAVVMEPFRSEKPDVYMTSSKSAYVPLLAAVDRSAAETAHTRPRAKPNVGAGSVGVGAKRADADFTGQFRDRDQALRDVGAMKARRDAAAAADGAARTTGKSKGMGWIGGPPRSTYKDHCREFDVHACDRQMSGTCNEPVVHQKHRVLDEEAEAYIAQVEQRKAMRNQGEYATTSSVNLQDRLREAEPTTFRRSHFFDKGAGGVSQMPKRGDAPLRKGTNQQDCKAMADINPSHFLSTKSMKERLALGGLKP